MQEFDRKEHFLPVCIHTNHMHSTPDDIKFVKSQYFKYQKLHNKKTLKFVYIFIYFLATPMYKNECQKFRIPSFLLKQQ